MHLYYLEHFANKSHREDVPFFSKMLRKGALIQHQQKRNVNVFSEFTKSSIKFRLLIVFIVKRQIEENKKLQKDIKLLSEEQAKGRDFMREKGN